jgi:hypothetical protein
LVLRDFGRHADEGMRSSHDAATEEALEVELQPGQGRTDASQFTLFEGMVNGAVIPEKVTGNEEQRISG